MAENLVICIARQFGSGGREIGHKLASSMEIDYYDKELLQQAAMKSGILQELFEKADEKPTGSLLNSLSTINANAGCKSAGVEDFLSYMPNDRLQNVLSDVIRDAAENSSCVIIGRCADYVLRGRPRVMSVFIHADLELRIKNVSRLHNIDEDAARSLIRKTDRNRANYYSFFTDRNWGLADNYHLTIDAGRLGIEKSARLVNQASELFCPR